MNEDTLAIQHALALLIIIALPMWIVAGVTLLTEKFPSIQKWIDKLANKLF
ncbi:hypothetical protein [Campylobacter curvus]|jgi:hypothetical protein|uniref:hypothetical protein n=1 Tax=Campylobacter curvus TaxID=200 RepID=UPI0014705FAD|nr:hypothetical protein [Campylobacter curvus]